MTQDASNLSPLDIIALVNSMQGRETGPLHGGYVDEHGSPVRVEWAKDGAPENTTIPLARSAAFSNPAIQQWAAQKEAEWNEAQRSEASGGEAAEVRTGGSGSLDATPFPPPLAGAANVLNLESGKGRWRAYDIALNDEQMKVVKRVVAECVRAQLLAKISELDEEVEGGTAGEAGGEEGGEALGEREVVEAAQARSGAEDEGGVAPQAPKRTRRHHEEAAPARRAEHGAADDAR